jgi:hypothetical protein
MFRSGATETVPEGAIRMSPSALVLAASRSARATTVAW